MRIPLSLSALAALALGSSMVLVPSPAHAAASQIGSSCLASNAIPGQTFVLTGSATNPAASPINGVLTKATFSVPNAAPATIPTTLKVMRATGTPNQYLVAAQTASEIQVPNTVSTQDVRLPVKAGDLLGLSSGTATFICTNGTTAADMTASFAGNAALGSTETYSAPAASVAIPVVATVEPDADGDGYGDVSQDLCPQSATVQATACPVIKLDSLASSSGRSITVIVASSGSAKVSVSGLAKVGGKKVKLKGGSKTVEPGSLTKFTVKVPAALKAALAKLPPSKKIAVTITSTTTNAAGQVSSDTTKVKLPGTK